MTKKIDWIQTFTGRRIRLMAPKLGDIDIIDIAHALSNQCRFVGHVRQFYSVAEHSVLVSLEAHEHPLDGLLHDASEAYLMDISSPLKHLLPDYQKFEEKFTRSIRSKFGLSHGMPPDVERADRRLRNLEARALMNGSLSGWGYSLTFRAPAVRALSRPLSPDGAEQLFLSRYRELT